MAFGAVTISGFLNIKTIFKLKTKDPVIEASRVSGFTITKNQRKLIVIGIVTTFFAIGSEVCSWIGFFLFPQFFDLPTSILLSWWIFITNNVFNCLTYIAIFETSVFDNLFSSSLATRSHYNDTGDAIENIELQNVQNTQAHTHTH